MVFFKSFGANILTGICLFHFPYKNNIIRIFRNGLLTFWALKKSSAI